MKEERVYTVYKHTSPSGKVYIGITSKTVEERWQKGRGYKGQVFYYAIQKYGWDNIKHEIIATGLTKEEAENMEIDLIAKYKSTNARHGYNVQNGGSGIGKMSEKTKEKLRIINKGRIVTEETKRKISMANKGRKHIVKNKNTKKIKHNHSDGNNPRAKKVFCGGLIFSCVKECAEYYGVPSSTMRKWLIGDIKMPQQFIKLGLCCAIEDDINTYPLYNKEIHGEKADIVIYNGNNRMTYCNGFIFPTIKECSEYYSESAYVMRTWLAGLYCMPQKYIELGLRYATEEDINTYPMYKKE